MTSRSSDTTEDAGQEKEARNNYVLKYHRMQFSKAQWELLLKKILSRPTWKKRRKFVGRPEKRKGAWQSRSIQNEEK